MIVNNKKLIIIISSCCQAVVTKNNYLEVRFLAFLQNYFLISPKVVDIFWTSQNKIIIYVQN